MTTFRLEWHGDEIAAAIAGQVPEALNYGAELLRGWAVDAAPVEDGDLRASAQVTPAASAADARAWVSFDTVYAWRQHEELGWRHPRGGGAKYLEGQLDAHRSEIIAAMANKLGGVIP